MRLGKLIEELAITKMVSVLTFEFLGVEIGLLDCYGFVIADIRADLRLPCDMPV